MSPNKPLVKPGVAAKPAVAASASLPDAVTVAARANAGGAVAEAGDNIGVIPVPKSLQPPAVAPATSGNKPSQSTTR